MRAARLVELLLHLQVRGRMTAAELASRLEVSERTVARDVEALAAAGIPVSSVRGPQGGYRLDGGYRTRLTGLGGAEAGVLALLGLGAVAADLGLEGDLELARTKVWASLTGDARAQAQRTAERVHLDPVRWYGTPEPAPLLADLAAATWADRQVRLTYARDGREVATQVEPLGLVLAAGDWYLVALREGARRTYRASRVRAVTVTDAPVSRPDGFDLPAVWAQARASLERRHDLIEVRLRVDAVALPRLRRLVAVQGQHLVDMRTVEDRVELAVPFEGQSWATTCLLGLGAAVEVLAPADLRERVAAEARGAAARYGPSSAGRPPA